MLASVIVPTRNKIPYLTLSLVGLTKQNISVDKFEVIVVNDGGPSVQNTIDTIYRLNKNMQIKLVERGQKGLEGNLAAARNAGLKEASTDICIFMDDDMIPFATFIEDYIRVSQEGYDVIKNPRYCHAFTIPCQLDKSHRDILQHSDNPRLVQIASASLPSDHSPLISPDDIVNDWGSLLRLSHSSQPHTEPRLAGLFRRDLVDLEAKWIVSGGSNVSYRRSLIEAIQGFDENFASYGLEDLECGYRAQINGAHFIVMSTANACHQYHYTNRSQQLISTFRNWNYFKTIHNTPEVWLWLSWRVLKDMDAFQYNNLLKGTRIGDSHMIAEVNTIIENLRRLTVDDILRRCVNTDPRP